MGWELGEKARFLPLVYEASLAMFGINSAMLALGAEFLILFIYLFTLTGKSRSHNAKQKQTSGVLRR